LTTLIQTEDYYLQIDSHMRFDPGWDEMLIQTLEGLNNKNPRSIISTYPCRFDYGESSPESEPESEPESVDEQTQPQDPSEIAWQRSRAIRKHPLVGHALVLRPILKEHLRPEHPVLLFHGVMRQTSEPVEGHHVGGGCLFSRASLMREVPLDSHLYFHGEEQNLAVRAWTSGWDIWHMPDMPIYHLYGESKRLGPKRPLHWDPEEDQMRAQRWHEQDALSKQRMAKLLYARGDAADLGPFRLGRERTLKEFAQASGIDYEARTISGPERTPAPNAHALTMLGASCPRPESVLQLGAPLVIDLLSASGGLNLNQTSWYQGTVLKTPLVNGKPLHLKHSGQRPNLAALLTKLTKPKPHADLLADSQPELLTRQP
jgi:hypothetical protein